MQALIDKLRISDGDFVTLTKPECDALIEVLDGIPRLLAAANRLVQTAESQAALSRSQEQG